MPVWSESIRFPTGQAFRLLRWQERDAELARLAADRPATVRGTGALWHSHPQLEFTIVTTGTGLRYVGDHTGLFTASDCLLVGSGLPHCWVETGQSSGYVLHFLFPPDHGIWQMGYDVELHALFNAASRGLQFAEDVSTEALSLLERFGRATPMVQTGLVLELFGLLHNAMALKAKSLSLSECGSGPGSAVSPRLEAVVQWILEHFHEPITLDMVLQRSGMSPATFARQFKRHTGKTFVEFLNDTRLTHAKQWLGSSHRSVAEIAFESGFNSLSHFGALFRTRYGTTPREERAKAEQTLAGSLSEISRNRGGLKRNTARE